MNYADQLNDDRWKLKREQILTRDWNMCQRCMRSKNLEVHHKKYIKGRMAWEYADWYLITLCGLCHAEIHQQGPIEVLEKGDPIVDGFDKIYRWLSALDSFYGKRP